MSLLRSLVPFEESLLFSHQPILAPADADDPAAVALGRALFFDKRLSVDNSIACASCFAEAISCAVARCLAQCAADPQAFGCRECRRINCDPQFGVCSGLGI